MSKPAKTIRLPSTALTQSRISCNVKATMHAVDLASQQVRTAATRPWHVHVTIPSEEFTLRHAAKLPKSHKAYKIRFCNYYFITGLWTPQLVYEGAVKSCTDWQQVFFTGTEGMTLAYTLDTQHAIHMGTFQQQPLPFTEHVLTDHGSFKIHVCMFVAWQSSCVLSYRSECCELYKELRKYSRRNISAKSNIDEQQKHC